jgi:hypothetical protein
MLQIKNYNIVLNKMHKRINFLSKAKGNVSIKKIDFLIKNIWFFLSSNCYIFLEYFFLIVFALYSRNYVAIKKNCFIFKTRKKTHEL